VFVVTVIAGLITVVVVVVLVVEVTVGFRVVIDVVVVMAKVDTVGLVGDLVVMVVVGAGVVVELDRASNNVELCVGKVVVEVTPAVEGSCKVGKVTGRAATLKRQSRNPLPS